MFDILKIRRIQGSQAIPDIRSATVSKPYRGFPILENDHCGRCTRCRESCPTGAIDLGPLSLDLGKCVFCGDCARLCPTQAIRFTTAHRLAASTREHLVVRAGDSADRYEETAVIAEKEIISLFGKSLKLRQVSAAGCNGCELELNACNNVNFDMGRFGIDFVASPRHADGILITGPISENMAPALEDAYRGVPEPRVIIAAGSCAISGGVFRKSPALSRGFLDAYSVDLYIPGCPVHPLAVVNGLLKLLGQ